MFERIVLKSMNIFNWSVMSWIWGALGIVFILSSLKKIWEEMIPQITLGVSFLLFAPTIYLLQDQIVIQWIACGLVFMGMSFIAWVVAGFFTLIES